MNDLREAVWHGLVVAPKAIPPKFFYDETGSRLFEAICGLPEYYPPRAERTILSGVAGDIAQWIGTGAVVIEPGSGSSDKVRLLLDALQPRAYIPVEICAEAVADASRRLRAEYPWLEVVPRSGDFDSLVRLAQWEGPERRVVFFPGSTIGNLDPGEAGAFLATLTEVVGREGGLLIGVDLKKDPGILEAAYNDSRGVTAAFNRNLLVRINRELGADFDPEAFVHRAFYNARSGRIEMHLVSRRDQTVRIDGHPFRFAAGEHLHTENSYKYTVEEFQDLAAAAGWRSRQVWTDPDRLFSVHYLDVAD